MAPKKRSEKPKGGGEGLIDLLALAVAGLLVFFLFPWPGALTACLLACWLVGFVPRRQAHDLAYFSLTVLAGVALELLFVWRGAWTYAYPSALGVPLWVPVAWGLLVLALKRSVSRA